MPAEPPTTTGGPGPSQPISRKVRTASAGHVVLCSPVPDMHAFARNVERLERSAEELSQGGSDIGEEIRKLSLEQKRSESRRSSIRESALALSTAALTITTTSTTSSRSRTASTSSYANSIVDVNGQARWGGYSPAAYVTSPAASLHSSSWSSHASVSRESSSAARPVRMTDLPEPVQEGRPLDSPLALSSSFVSPTRQTSRSSWAPRQASVITQTSEKAEGVVIHGSGWEQGERPQAPSGADEADRVVPIDFPQELEQHSSHTTPPDRPRSSDTSQQARSLFRDFDGVHYSSTHEASDEIDAAGREAVRRPSLQEAPARSPDHERTPRARPVTYGSRPISYAEPLPGQNMVYYPAPVPRMINLPKRLSQLPAATIQAQAKRNSQMLPSMPVDVRKSAPWLPMLPRMDFEAEHDEQAQQSDAPLSSAEQRHSMMDLSPVRSNEADERRLTSTNTRHSMMNLSNVPPQLRASVFQSYHHDVEVQGSAVATLDSILAASVTAPVSAFTDHPLAGHLGEEVFGRERPNKRHTMGGNLIDHTKNNNDLQGEIDRKRMRASPGGLQRSTTEPELVKQSRRSSILSMFTDLGNPDGRKLRKRSLSVKSLHAHVDDDDAEHEEDEYEIHDGEEDGHYSNDEQGEAEEPVHAAPTTLLAELRLRKAQQKSRSRTAATAFPNGMHSTLLELDAVAQVEKKKRQGQRTTLAWEISVVQDEPDYDEDVPLGVLYGNKRPTVRSRPTGGAADWDRPLGLMERRDLEDNEPLSRRRNRLLGVTPAQQAAEDAARDATLQDEEEDEHADEPLAERVRRLKQKGALTDALGDVAKPDKHESVLSEEIFTQLGLDTTDSAADKDNVPTAVEDETLGQRRARLELERQRNADESAIASKPRPRIQSSQSLANLLSAHPSGPIAGTGRRYRDPAPGTLLAANDKAQDEARRKLRAQNTRSTSYITMPAHLPQQQLQQRPTTMMFGQSLSQPAHARSGLQSSASMPVGMHGYGAAQPGFYAPGAGAGAGAGAATGLMDPYAQMPMQMQLQMQMQMPMNGMMAAPYQHFPVMATAGPMQYSQPMGVVPQMPMEIQRGAVPMAVPMMPLGFPGMTAQEQMQLAGMEPAQRENILRWRMSVAGR